MRRPFIAALLPALFAGCTTIGPDDIASASPVDRRVAVSEARLASVRSDRPELDVAALDRIDDLDMTRSVAWTQMDNWFAEEGTDLIAANLLRETAVLRPGF